MTGLRDARYQLIWDTVLDIPPGRVASYGQVARVAGLEQRARLVGKALRELPEGSAVPWFRVLNAAGKLSLTREGASLQRSLLEAEGVIFENGRVDLKRFGWQA
jgi:methylated-DNA-protein-cysteine methyltransferase-like protein